MKLGPYLLGPNDVNQGVYIGDARILAEAIPDESVDLIFTDPVYQRIDDYRWLAETAARVLKPDSACLVWIATPLLSKAIRAMEPLLDYAWLMIWQKVGPVYPGKPGMCKYAACLWMQKGHSKTYNKIWDVYVGGRGNKLPIYDTDHKWRKSADNIAFWLDAFSFPGAIVFDPFTGSGTVPAVCKMLNRRYLAFEIIPQTAIDARQRIANTPPPLPGLVANQLALEEDDLHP